MKGLKYLQLIALCVLTLSLFSCQDDDEIFDRLTGETWVGDLGFSDRYGEKLESGLFFKNNGFGYDDQCYFDDPRVVTTMDFRWTVRNGDLILDYGINQPLLEIRGIYVGDSELTGALYVDGENDGSITLRRMR